MTDDSPLENGISVPSELQQKLPRRIRLAGRGIYYLVGSAAVSALLCAFIVASLSKTAKAVSNGRELARDGRKAYTGDLRAGGLHSATVYYSFTYDGNLYSGKAALPERYLRKIPDYSKSSDFPVLFLPRDPSINHPYDWHDDESYSFDVLSYLLIAIVVIQWSVLGKSILRDLRLVRNGVVAIANVTGCSYGRNGGILLKYEFRDPDDLLTEGRGESQVRRKQGDRICILYLPEETGRSRPYPPVFFRAAK